MTVDKPLIPDKSPLRVIDPQVDIGEGCFQRGRAISTIGCVARGRGPRAAFSFSGAPGSVVAASSARDRVATSAAVTGGADGFVHCSAIITKVSKSPGRPLVGSADRINGALRQFRQSGLCTRCQTRNRKCALPRLGPRFADPRASTLEPSGADPPVSSLPGLSVERSMNVSIHRRVV